jgi:AcrR family transcriptional regulator
MEARITAAARESFAEHGWAGTTMRAVARAAGVDAALVHYYFSSKQQLLDASTTPPPEWLASIRRASAGPLRTRGEVIVRSLIENWTQPEIREVLSSILQTAAHEARTREKLRAFVATSLLPAVADQLGDEERLLRAQLIASHVLGVVMMRWVWQIEPLASLPDEDLVAVLAPVVQRYLARPLR